MAGTGAGLLALSACSGQSAQDAEDTDTTASSALGENPDDAEKLAISSDSWSYDADSNTYYQIGLPYCANPEADAYESMGVYVPGSYFKGTKNDDGTYSCTIDSTAICGNFTAATAPVVIPINTAGYAAQAAPTSYSAQGLTDYLEAGLIYVYPGARGRNNGTNDDGTSFAGGAPWGVTDFKAAIRALRYSAASIPGGAEHIFTFGHSGGGAQSSLVGTTGDSALYAPYLEHIGALFTDRDGKALSDAIDGAMCWCPITSLDIADEAYEWMMGQFGDSGTRADGTWTRQLSSDMAEKFADYVNTMAFTKDGEMLELTEGGEGTYTAGSYYEMVVSAIEDSLNDFLADTEFPYTPSSTTMADGGFAGGGTSGGTPSGPAPSGDAPTGDMSSSSALTGSAPSSSAPTGSALSDNSSTGEAPSGAAPSAQGSASNTSSDATTYETAEDYIASLNEDTAWVSYDSSTNTATISGMGDFVTHCKTATKDVGAFDELDRGAAENYLFGTGTSDNLHFDRIMAELLDENEDVYAKLSDFDESYVSAYAGDLESTDDLGTVSADRQNMYNPLYFAAKSLDGYGTSTICPHWRIRTGIEQGDTSLTTELDLALVLEENPGVQDVDFATVWGKGHTTAERSGSAATNFISWVESCSGAAQ
ncbi:MAG: subtype A tannase [Atopobiaceae bacterium]